MRVSLHGNVARPEFDISELCPQFLIQGFPGNICVTRMEYVFVENNSIRIIIVGVRVRVC